MRRQALLGQINGPRLWAMVDEAALRRLVGSAEVMRAQLERLVEATKQPNITLQVLPFGASAHPAMVSAFSLLRFGDEQLPDVVYLEHLTNALYLDRRDDVERYLQVMESLCVRSQPREQIPEILTAMLVGRVVFPPGEGIGRTRPGAGSRPRRGRSSPSNRHCRAITVCNSWCFSCILYGDFLAPQQLPGWVPSGVP